MSQPPRSVVRFGGACLWISAAVLASHVGHALVFYKNHALAAAMAALCLGAIAARFALAPAGRVKAGLALLSTLLVVHAFELAIALRSPAPASAAARAGRPWDSRPMGDVLHDLRAAGDDAWPSARPRQLFKERRRGITVGGREALPFGGISGVTTILCNESGTWAVYPADEHGFNNPRGLWSGASGASGGIEIALLGDSFTQGACVPPEENLAAVVRARHPGTLDLGMLGDGPLIELGTLIEMLPAVRPKRVLWLYFRNDLSDLNLEKRGPLLRRYVDEEGFSLGLADAQPAVDAALKEAISRLESEVAWWPSKLRAVGLTRQSAPVLLQDLVMNERNASSTAALRLEHLVGVFAGGDPEAPSARNPPDWALFERVLAKAGRVVASWGGTLTFVYLPDFWPPGAPGLDDHPNRAEVLAAVGRVGLPVIDVHAALRGRDQERLLFFHQSHCNRDGYAALGEAILAGLDRAEDRALAP